ncbi:hypothetical protein ACFV14_33885 [Streptomyces zaomyceticus]|uniref:hypothetical protein n=1 Tax=Streptomyces zaomyceticus TaxID=68286 RepID=UPI00369350AB
MGRRLERKMLRKLEGGEPVELHTRSTTYKGLARLAFLAEQFGYEYADLRQEDKSFTLHLVPDPRPQARERAAENRSRYPRAAEGGPLPVPDPGTLALLRARMLSDVYRRTSMKRILPYVGVALTIGALELGFEFGDDRASAFTIAGVFLGATVVLMTALFLWSRQVNLKNKAVLEAAGFTLVPDARGRLRHVPPGDEARRAGEGDALVGRGSE